MKCPYCATTIHVNWNEIIFPSRLPGVCDSDLEDGYAIQHGFCPECRKLIVYLRHGVVTSGYDNDNRFWMTDVEEENIIYPRYSVGRNLNQYVPEKYAQLFQESEEVNNISPRASATLSRYLLQMLLHEELQIQKKNLEEELTELERRGNIPTKLVTMLQVMRRVANFGAHPKKSTNSNEIVEVEEGESTVMLDLLEEVFDYIFVKPKQQKLFLKDIEEKYGIRV